MGQRKGRQAQAWACQLAYKMADMVKGGTVLPFILPNIGLQERGYALRFCQEVNYAKKQEEAKGAKPSYWTLKAIKVEGTELFQITLCKPKVGGSYSNPAHEQRVSDVLAGLEELSPTVFEPAKGVAYFEPPPQADSPPAGLPQPAAKPDPQEELLRKMYGEDLP